VFNLIQYEFSDLGKKEKKRKKKKCRSEIWRRGWSLQTDAEAIEEL
jgi:hypothetical protein